MSKPHFGHSGDFWGEGAESGSASKRALDKPIPYLSVAIFLGIFILAASFRFASLSAHSDAQRANSEDEFLQLQKSLELPSSFSSYLDPAHSSLNPFVVDHDLSFPIYGSFPTLVTKIAILPNAEESPSTLRHRARFAGALTDLFVLIMVCLAGARTFSLRVGLFAMALYAVFPLPIAHAHEFTSSWAAILANILVLCIFLPARREDAPSSILSFILFGIFFGLASALDPRNLLLAATLPFLFLIRGVSSKGNIVGFSPERDPVFFSLIYSVTALVTTWFTWRLSQPYAFAEGSMLEFSPEFLDAGANILLGETPAIPELVHVSLDSHAHLAKILEFGLWGFGPLGFVALLLVLFGGVLPRALFGGDLRSIGLGTVVFAYLVLPFFQKHPDPFTILFACPAAAILIAEFIVSAFSSSRANEGYRKKAPKDMLLPVLEIVLVGTGLIAALISGSLYGGTHPLDTASRWLADNLPRGKTILVERQSVHLPGPIEGKVPGPYRFSEFSPLAADFKVEDKFFQAQLRKSDALVFSSSSTRELAQMNPGPAAAFFRTLFAGNTEFQLEAGFACTPRLMTWEKFRRWVPPELRYDRCPEISIFLPKDTPPPA